MNAKDVRVVGIGPDGSGVAELPGTVHSIPGAVPGDRVDLGPGERVCIHPRGGAGAFACPHPACPGCPLQSVPYPEQLEAKRGLVERCFRARMAPGDLPAVLEARPSLYTLGYRSTAKLALQRQGRGVALGVFRRGSHRVVDLPRCPVHAPAIATAVRALRRLLAKAGHLASNRAGGAGWLRYAAFQASGDSEALLLTLVTREQDPGGLLGSLAARLRETLPTVRGIVHNCNPSAGNEIFGPYWTCLWGEDRITERFGRLRLSAHAGSFLQANRPQAAWAYATAAAWLAPHAGETVLDLYCGVGGLALSLAGAESRMVGIEANPLAAADARRNAAANGIEAEIHAGAVEDRLPALLAAGLRPHVVTLNPARKGIAPAVATAICDAAPRAVAYLSCNPETLARDCANLCGSREYRITQIQPIDFFPQTAHVETLVLLERCG